MAGHCGMTLDQVMKGHTYRQYLAFCDWVAWRMNHPGVTEHYLMQVAKEVFLSVRKDESREKTPLSDFKLQFGEPEPEQPLTEEELRVKSQIAMGAWRSKVGMIPDAQ